MNAHFDVTCAIQMGTMELFRSSPDPLGGSRVRPA